MFVAYYVLPWVGVFESDRKFIIIAENLRRCHSRTGAGLSGRPHGVPRVRHLRRAGQPTIHCATSRFMLKGQAFAGHEGTLETYLVISLAVFAREILRSTRHAHGTVS